MKTMKMIDLLNKIRKLEESDNNVKKRNIS